MQSTIQYGNIEVPRWNGAFRATVTNNQDPYQRGRVKFNCPMIHGNKESFWAMPIGMCAGTQAGFFFIPPVGSKIWVFFENGKPNRPLWMPGWWGDNDTPIEAKSNYGKVWVIRTPTGHKIIFDGGAKTAKLTIASAGGIKVVLDDTQNILYLNGDSGTLSDNTSDVITRGDLATYDQNLRNDLKTYLTTWATASLQPGAGAAGPSSTMTATTITTSSKVRSA